MAYDGTQAAHTLQAWWKSVRDTCIQKQEVGHVPIQKHSAEKERQGDRHTERQIGIRGPYAGRKGTKRWGHSQIVWQWPL